MVTVPLWFAQAMMFLGGFWVILGWAFNLALWVIGLVIAAVIALIFKRRYASLTLQSWSKGRGMVIWVYRRMPDLGVQPRLVWDSSDSPPTSDPPPDSEMPRAEP
jgi:hypothetical protein